MSSIHIRRAFLPALVVAFGLALGVPEGAQAQISVIVGPSSANAPTQEEVVKMFRGSSTTWSDGTKIQIVDQPGTPVGEQFYSQVVGQSASAVRKVFIELVLSGQAAKPKTASSDAEVKAAVASTPGAIGYIQSSSMDATVKEVLKVN